MLNNGIVKGLFFISAFIFCVGCGETNIPQTEEKPTIKKHHNGNCKSCDLAPFPDTSKIGCRLAPVKLDKSNNTNHIFNSNRPRFCHRLISRNINAKEKERLEENGWELQDSITCRSETIIFFWENIIKEETTQAAQDRETAETGENKFLTFDYQILNQDPLNSTSTIASGQVKINNDSSEILPGCSIVYSPHKNQNSDTTIIVAVLDSGVDLENDTIRNHLWSPSENTSKFKTKNSFTHQTKDIDGHGTHVTSIILNGVPPTIDLQIMNLKVLEGGEGSLFYGLKAICYAIDNGAKVINISWGFYDTLQQDDVALAVMKDIFLKAQNEGVIIVTSTGNLKNNNDSNPHWPSNIMTELKINRPSSGIDPVGPIIPNPIGIDPSVIDNKKSNIIAVSSIDCDSDTLSCFSNYGNKTVNVAAPGQCILGYALGGGYEIRSGTSMAAPFVTRIAAILYARKRASKGQFSPEKDLQLSQDVLRCIYNNSKVPQDSAPGKFVMKITNQEEILKQCQ